MPQNDDKNDESTLFTVFGSRVRLYLTFLLGFTSLASSLTATIYFPLIPLLADRFQVTIQAVNLTITVYVIFQALSPAFFAPLSDSFGRRPLYLVLFAIYTLASLGLALNQRSYAGLLVLRAIQSIGGSAVMALSYGVVADVAVSSQRGRMLAPMLAATNLGPCLGPVIGGTVAYVSSDFVWCFWALFIFGALSLLLIGFTLPETARSIVGNGITAPHGIWRTWRPSTSIWPGLGPRCGEGDGDHTGRGTFNARNPLACLRTLFYPDAALILWLSASPYAVWYCIQTIIPILYSRIYGYNDLDVGLCFLAGGSGVIAGGFVAGKMMDRNYRQAAESEGISVDRARGDDIQTFPIETARSRYSSRLLVLHGALLIGYAWSAQFAVHPAVPLVLQAAIGSMCTILLQVYSALLIDVFPASPSTASAAGNITRCGLSAVAVAVLNPLTGAIGYGWVFTAIALLNSGLGLLAVQVLRRYGPAWRTRRVKQP